MSVQVSGDKITFTDGSTVASGWSGFKNRIINGAMMIDQRNAGAAVTTYTASTTKYTLDRWGIFGTLANKFTTQQTPSATETGYATRVAAGFTNYLAITSSAATSAGSTDEYEVHQKIEGFNTADFAWGTANAKSVTISFLVYSSLTGTFGGSVTNGGYNRSYPFSYTISAANTWEQKTVTIAGDTSGTWLTTNGTGLFLCFDLGSGSSLKTTANTWAAGYYTAPTGATSVVGTSGATFYITGVQLEKGSTATSFDYRSYGTELALCQRYYYKIKPDATTKLLSLSAQCYSTTGFVCYNQFPVTMRTRPTALEQSGTASDYGVFNAGTSVLACNSVINYNTTTTADAAMSEGTVASGLVAGNTTALVTRATSAYFAWSAEL